MRFEIQTTNYFDAEAKRLAKRHSSFVDDLQDLRDNLLKNPYQGTELSPGIRKVRLTISSKGRGKSGVQTHSFSRAYKPFVKADKPSG